MVPRDLEEPAILFIQEINKVLRSVIKGQVIVATILAALYVAGLSLVGLHAAVAIGLTAGLCRIIPYLDVLVGGSLCLLVILADTADLGLLFAVACVFVIIQSLDGMIITPRVIGERVGLHPFLVIISIIAFGDLFGFFGILLAIPCIAIVKLIVQNLKPIYYASRAYDPNNHPRAN